MGQGKSRRVFKAVTTALLLVILGISPLCEPVGAARAAPGVTDAASEEQSEGAANNELDTTNENEIDDVDPEDDGFLHSVFDFDDDSAEDALLFDDEDDMYFDDEVGPMDEEEQLLEDDMEPQQTAPLYNDRLDVEGERVNEGGVPQTNENANSQQPKDEDDMLGESIPDFSLIDGSLPARSVYSNSFVKAANRPNPHEKKCVLQGLSREDACARVSTDKKCIQADKSGFLKFVACHSMKAFAITLLLALALSLLYAMVIVAERFYAYSLLNLSNTLSIGPELSAQLLALTNSMPNVFGIVGAMTHGARPNPSLATSACLGCCIFVNAVVLGAVGLSSKSMVKLTRHSLLDVGLYGLGLVFALGTFLSGSISAVSGVIMLVLWVVYFVLALERDSRRLAKEDKDNTIPSFTLPTDNTVSDVGPDTRTSASGESTDTFERMKATIQQWVASQTEDTGSSAPKLQKALTPVRLPVMALLCLTMPDPSTRASKPYVVAVAIFGSLFSLLTSGMTPLLSTALPFSPVLYICAVALAAAAAAVAACPREGLKGGSLALSMLAFAQSISWMHFSADVLVSVADVLARLAGASHAVLGVTLLGWGAGLVDLVANATVARLGAATIAASATFASCAFSLLATLGVTFAGQATTRALQVRASNGLISLFAVAIIFLALGGASAQLGLGKAGGSLLLGLYAAFATVFAISQAV